MLSWNPFDKSSLEAELESEVIFQRYFDAVEYMIGENDEGKLFDFGTSEELAKLAIMGLEGTVALLGMFAATLTAATGREFTREAVFLVFKASKYGVAFLDLGGDDATGSD